MTDGKTSAEAISELENFRTSCQWQCPNYMHSYNWKSWSSHLSPVQHHCPNYFTLYTLHYCCLFVHLCQAQKMWSSVVYYLLHYISTTLLLSIWTPMSSLNTKDAVQHHLCLLFVYITFPLLRCYITVKSYNSYNVYIDKIDWFHWFHGQGWIVQTCGKEVS